MSDDNRLAPEVMIALNALENARAWDCRGVTSQDVAALAGMETSDLIDLTNEALNYCYKRGQEWAKELAERDEHFQEWIKRETGSLNEKGKEVKMVGTVAGGRKAAATNKAKYGADFYAKIGSEGGSRGHTGGFASEKVGDDGLTGFERARIAGRKGGAISKRGPAKKKRLSFLDQVKVYCAENNLTIDIDAEMKKIERELKEPYIDMDTIKELERQIKSGD